MEITRTEKIGFWLRFTGIQLLYGIVILLAIPLFPIAYFIRHVLKVEGRKNPLWLFLNYTEDNDWGLSHYKDNPPKKNFWNAVKWFFRNPAWNFILLFKPRWYNGEVDVFETVKYTLLPIVPTSINKWMWANKDAGIYGTNHLYYKINGRTYGRYSFAQKKGLIKELQLGTSGNRYKLRLKL